MGVREIIAELTRLSAREDDLEREEAALLSALVKGDAEAGWARQLKAALDHRARAVEARGALVAQLKRSVASARRPSLPPEEARAWAAHLSAHLSAQVDGLSSGQLSRVVSAALGQPQRDLEATLYAPDAVDAISSGISQEAELLSALFAEAPVEDEAIHPSYAEDYEDIDLETIPAQLAELLGGTDDEDLPSLARILAETPQALELPHAPTREVNTSEIPADLLELARNAPGEADEDLNALLEEASPEQLEAILKREQLARIGDTSHLLRAEEGSAPSNEPPSREDEEIVDWIREEIQKQRAIYQRKDRDAEVVTPDEYVKLVTDLSGMLGFDGDQFEDFDLEGEGSLEMFLNGEAPDVVSLEAGDEIIEATPAPIEGLMDEEGDLERELGPPMEIEPAMREVEDLAQQGAASISVEMPPPSPAPSPGSSDEREGAMDLPDDVLSFLDVAERLETQNRAQRSPLRAPPREVQAILTTLAPEASPRALKATEDEAPQQPPAPSIPDDLPDDLAALLAAAEDDTPPQPPAPSIPDDLPDDLA
ncbi:hypothetical protein KJ940_07965, partial [Myxococcota bacterium]|nr:hypothetical protein [Myxococcota bacterium]